MSLKQYLKALRAINDLTQENLAVLLDMTVSSYNRKENGKRDFTIKEAIALSSIFEKSVEEIFDICSLGNNVDKLTEVIK